MILELDGIGSPLDNPLGEPRIEVKERMSCILIKYFFQLYKKAKIMYSQIRYRHSPVKLIT